MSNGDPVDGYIITRYGAAGTSEQTIVSGTCASLVTATSCSESSTPPGTWQYSVTPAYRDWRGAESDKTSATVENPSLTLSPVLTKSPNTLSGTLSNFGDGETIRFHLDDVSGSELIGTVNSSPTPAAVPSGGSAAVSVTLPAGVSDGPHSVFAVASSSGDIATAAVTLDSTAPPTPTIASAPANSTSATSASFGFTDSEAGVSFECRLNEGSYSVCVSPKSYSELADGPHTFDVRAVDAAGNHSAAASHTWTVDVQGPSVNIAFPVADAHYNNAGYIAGCGTGLIGDICGTASDDTGTGVSVVQVSIKRGSGNYWDGSGFSSASEVLLNATGTTNWSYGFPASNLSADGDYTIRVVVTDGVGNTRSATTTFTVDNTPPAGIAVQTSNVAGGTSGRAEVGDHVTFTLNEAIKPASVLANWTGTATDVVVRINNGGLGNDTLTVWDAANSAQLPLGTVDLGRSDYVRLTDVAFGATGTPSSMVQDGSSISITLGTPNSPLNVTTALGNGTMRWTPAAGATDMAGNAVSTTSVTEPGAADPEF